MLFRSKYSPDDFTEPARFTPEQLTLIANNEFFKYPVGVRIPIHCLLHTYFEPQALLDGLSASTNLSRETQPRRYDWSRLPLEKRRQLITLMEEMAVDAAEGDVDPQAQATHPDERKVAKRNGKLNGKQHGFPRPG